MSGIKRYAIRNGKVVDITNEKPEPSKNFRIKRYDKTPIKWKYKGGNKV
jgi:hypothetical protein